MKWFVDWFLFGTETVKKRVTVWSDQVSLGRESCTPIAIWVTELFVGARYRFDESHTDSRTSVITSRYLGFTKFLISKIRRLHKLLSFELRVYKNQNKVRYHPATSLVLGRSPTLLVTLPCIHVPCNRKPESIPEVRLLRLRRDFRVRDWRVRPRITPPGVKRLWEQGNLWSQWSV